MSTGTDTGDSSAPAANATTGQETQRDWREHVLIGNHNAGHELSPFPDIVNYTWGISDVCDRNPDTEVLMLRDPNDNANLRYFEIWFTEGLRDESKGYSHYLTPSESKLITTSIAGFSVTTSSKTTEHGKNSLPQGGWWLTVKTCKRLYRPHILVIRLIGLIRFYAVKLQGIKVADISLVQKRYFIVADNTHGTA